MGQSSTANGTGQNSFREETIDGTEYLVHDVVAQREGVYTYPDPNGGVRREFISAEELEGSIEGVDEVPIVLRHPEDPDGNPTQTTHPRANFSEVGKWSDLRPTNANDGIAGSVYIRANEIGEHDGDLRKYKNQVEQFGVGEVSTGYDIQQAVKDPGRYNGMKYSHKQVGPSLDHLALLPDKEGDCSVEDGCGLGRANEVEESQVRVNHYIPDVDGPDENSGLSFSELGKIFAKAFGIQSKQSNSRSNQMEDEDKIDELVEEYNLTRENIAHLSGTECLGRIHETMVENEGGSNKEMPENGGEGENDGLTEDQREEVQSIVSSAVEENTASADDIVDQLAEEDLSVDPDEVVDQAAEQAAEEVEKARANERNITLIDQSEQVPLEREQLERMNSEVVSDMAEDLEEEQEEQSQSARANFAGREMGPSFNESDFDGDDFDVPVAGENPGGDE
jgi:hypothetical protein